MITWEQLIGLNIKDLHAYLNDRESRVINMSDQKPFKVQSAIPLSLLFDESNAAIGEDWDWSGDVYYFAREADALWFAMRWS